MISKNVVPFLGTYQCTHEYLVLLSISTWHRVLLYYEYSSRRL